MVRPWKAPSKESMLRSGEPGACRHTCIHIHTIIIWYKSTHIYKHTHTCTHTYTHANCHNSNPFISIQQIKCQLYDYHVSALYHINTFFITPSLSSPQALSSCLLHSPQCSFHNASTSISHTPDLSVTLLSKKVKKLSKKGRAPASCGRTFSEAWSSTWLHKLEVISSSVKSTSTPLSRAWHGKVYKDDG